MNGIVTSLVVSGDGVKPKDITALNRKMERLVDDYAIEVVVCFSKRPNFEAHQRKIVFTYSKNSRPLQQAVAISSGDVLVFSTLRNFLLDKHNLMLDQALNTKIEGLVVTFTKGLMAGVGLSKTIKIPYAIARKETVLEFAYKIRSFNSLVDDAAKTGAAVKFMASRVRLPEYLSNKLPAVGPHNGRGGGAAGLNKPADKRLVYTSDIPAFIISRDRLEPLQKLINWCEDEGLKNIVIIDNASTYPPLLKYLLKTQHEVIFLNYNVGYLSPWSTGIVAIYAKGKPYIVTDADIVPLSEAHGAVRVFHELLNKYPGYVKAGFGLKVDDIPKHYEPRDFVISWEKQFWKKELEKDVYNADIDTTFAVWRPNTHHTYGPSLRTGGNYVARHDTWYADTKNPPDEVLYYQSHADKVMGTWSTDPADLAELYIRHNEKGRKPTSSKD